MNLAGNRSALGNHARRLMVDAQVWREQRTDDGGGGFVTDWVDQLRTVRVLLVAPTDRERETAHQAGVQITHAALFPADVDVDRGDRLVVPGQPDPVELVSGPKTATHPAVARAPVKQEPWKQPLT